MQPTVLTLQHSEVKMEGGNKWLFGFEGYPLFTVEMFSIAI